MSPSHRQAFTLIEALIALSLAAVVAALAWMLLDSTRRVSGEVARPIRTPLDAVRESFEFEFDRVTALTGDPQLPPVTVSGPYGLGLVALLPDDRGIPYLTRVQYRLEGRALERVSGSGDPLVLTTNRVADQVRLFQTRAIREGEVFAEWPEADRNAVPDRVSVQLVLESGDELDTTFFIPASMRVDLTDPETGTD